MVGAGWLRKPSSSLLLSGLMVGCAEKFLINLLKVESAYFQQLSLMRE
jgi:hypothetical protein